MVRLTSVVVAMCMAFGGAFVGPPPAMHRAARGAARAHTILSSTNVKTIAETVQDFNGRYRRPIVPIWRSPLNDMLQVTHLSVVSPKFKYDMIFGYGLVQTFDFLLEQYPMAEESSKIRDASMGALGLDVAQALSDHAAVKTWLEGKSESDLLAAADGSPVASALTLGKSGDYLQSRASNMALVHMMEAAGCDINDATCEKWAGALELKASLIQKDMQLYKQTKDKMEQGMQMVKALEIREKKRMAAALEEKAKKAQAAAEEAAKAASEPKAA